jgi:hypothetical protein
MDYIELLTFLVTCPKADWINPKLGCAAALPIPEMHN